MGAKKLRKAALEVLKSIAEDTTQSTGDRIDAAAKLASYTPNDRRY